MKKWANTRFAMGLAACLAASPLLPQVPFSLDTSFRTNIQDRNVNALHLLPDGKLFLSGQIRFPEDYNAGEIVFRSSARLFEDGTRDMTFPVSPAGGRIEPWVDGMFYVAAGLPRRKQSNGTNDPSFISMATGPYFNPIQSGDFHVYPDGSVLISGAHMLSDTIRGFTGPHHLIWFTNTGYLDTTRTHRKAGGAVYRFAELPDGKFICNGTSFNYGGQPVDRIFRIHPDGALDTTFQTGVFWGSAFTYLPLADGRVYVGGNYATTQVPGDTLRLARFLSDGMLDPSFTIAAFTAGEGLSTSSGAAVHGITPWRNGQLIVTGQFKRVNGQVRKGICMIDTTGQLLDTFAEAGVGPFTYQGVTNAGLLKPVFDADTTFMYICGAYVGYDDGTTNDPLQRFVTRLHVGDITTGVPVVEKTPLRSLTAHPNPANAWVALNHNVPGNTAALQLVVRDMTGRPLRTFNTGGERGQTVWDTRNVMPGIYTVELHDGDRTFGTVRVVVQR